MKKILICDMDIVAYRAAAAIEERTIKVVHKATNREKEFKTRTEFKKFLKDKNFTYDPNDYIITDLQKSASIDVSTKIVKSQITKVIDNLDIDEVEGYIGGENNFRLKLSLPKPYKGNRKDMIRPLLLDETKEYVLSRYRGLKIDNREVDDHVVIRWHELDSKGHDPIILTIDKDSKGCIGTKYYDYSKEDARIIEVPIWGYLEHNKVKNKVDGLGLQFYCYQLLKGDSTDSYSPSDLHTERFGDVSIVSLINSCKNVDELFSAVEKKYKSWFPTPVTYIDQNNEKVTKSYSDLLNIYHQCVYMQRKVDDETTFYDLWKEFK